MNTQILEDAKEVGFDFNSSGMSLKYEANLIVKLTKFAELIKARTIAELDALKQPIDERAEFEAWFDKEFTDIDVSNAEIAKGKSNMLFGWQARSQLPTNSNEAVTNALEKIIKSCEIERDGYDEPLRGWDLSNAQQSNCAGYQEACNDIIRNIDAMKEGK